VQFDKMPCTELCRAVDVLRGLNHNIVIMAAGGINESNVEQFAQTGVNAIVTTAVYFGKPVDIGAKIVRK